ncbi:uncharacterized protein LOC134318339 [Trichomycterus rosablanca]|uniref:uncharacterized protein LOC134318339 n=1 Tax=Trichomycterus rosablanca TaxID=2290929 RepID=UPI002F355BD9
MRSLCSVLEVEENLTYVLGTVRIRQHLPFIFRVSQRFVLSRGVFSFSRFSLVSPDRFCSWCCFAFVFPFCSLLPLAAWSGTVFGGCCGNQPIDRWRADSTHTCASFLISSTPAFIRRLFLHSSPDCLLTIRPSPPLLVPPLLVLLRSYGFLFSGPTVPGLPAFLHPFSTYILHFGSSTHRSFPASRFIAPGHLSALQFPGATSTALAAPLSFCLSGTIGLPDCGLERYCSRSSLRKPANGSVEGGLYSPVPRFPSHQPLHLNAGFSSALRQIVCLPTRFGSFVPGILVPPLLVSQHSCRLPDLIPSLFVSWFHRSWFPSVPATSRT